ncbi:MAG: COX15/CtaA family protein [Polyangiales bacterium]
MKTVHLVAIVTAVATWALLLVGCMVHGTGSSLACPDWPTCYGTFFPEMKGGVAYEHGHRLVATTVGFMTLVLATMLWLQRKANAYTRTTAKLGIVAALLVVAQGVLGGITVLYQLPIGVTLSHLATSMCFFSLLVYIALRTSPARIAKQAGTVAIARTAEAANFGVRQPDLATASTPTRLRRLLVAGCAATLGQILFGGLVRHTHNGLACYDVPLCEIARGSVSRVAGRSGFLARVIPERVGQQLQMGHRFYAVLLALWIVFVAVTIFRKTQSGEPLRMLSTALVGLIVAQIALGLISVVYALPLIPVTAHLGVAALILVTHVMMIVRVGEMALPALAHKRASFDRIASSSRHVAASASATLGGA